MSVVFGVLVVLGLFYLYNGWWLKKIINKIRNRNLEERRLSEAVRKVYQTYRKNDYDEFSALLPSLNRDEVYELQKAFANEEVDLALLQRFVGVHSQSPEALFLLGGQLVTEAWKVRGGGAGNTVSAANATRFQQYLQQADTTLRAALALAPDYVDVYMPLITSQMGMSNRMESKMLFQQAQGIEPGRLDYSLAMLNQCTEKWGGSHERMFELAENEACANNAVCRAGLIAAAHYEYWLTLEGVEKKQYYQQKQVREQLQAAYDLLPPAGEKASGFRERHQRMLALNYFSLTFVFMNEKKKAKKVFQQIGKDYTRYPWAYMDESPGNAFLKCKGVVGV